MTDDVQYDYGSFRDPSGAVFYLGNDVYRRIDEETFAVMRRLREEGRLDKLAEKGRIVGTRIVDEEDAVYPSLRERIPGAKHFLQHEKIPMLNYAYEWTYSMIADAARLQLELQMELIRDGYSLKDASIYNIQFVGSNPVFIDIPSIEEARRKDVWVAYGQFCRMFLFPLLLKRFHRCDTREYYLAHIDGLSVDQVQHMLGKRLSLRPSLLVDVFLQNMLQSYGSRHPSMTGRQNAARKMESSASPQIMNLQRLLGKVEKLSASASPDSRRSEGHWSSYSSTHSYSSEDEAAKTEFVSTFVKENRPDRVLDLGCNTGRYSMVAAKQGAAVVAVDSDHDCVDLLYRRIRNERPNVLPLWVDISNPSPGLGFRNRERKAFLERIDVDCIFALALIHHLLVTCRIPMREIRDLFHDLTSEWLVIEFVDLDDPMFQRLLLLRENIYEHITRDYFEKIFSEKFEIVGRRESIPGRRTLYALRKK